MISPSRSWLDGVVWTTSTTFLLILLATQADAAAPKAAPDAAATWREECGSCHVPYPARLLPAGAWNSLLDGLDRHFGVDASLGQAPLAQVRGYLVARAEPGPALRAGATPPRITTSAWFRHEHDEVDAAVWKRAAVRSAANCGACHTGAAQGNFDENSVRIPR